MEKEIEDIIKSKLPEQVGEILRKRLEQAELDAATVKRNAESLEDKDNLIADMSRNLSEYKKLDDRNQALETREKAVKEAEIKQEVEKLKIQLEESNKRTELVVGFTAGLVRNTEFRKTLWDNQSQAGYQGANGVWVYPPPINVNKSEENKAT